jgi:hypothetical protein
MNTTLPEEIISKIISYYSDIQISQRNSSGWKEINKELYLFKYDRKRWIQNMFLYKTIRWRLAGYIVVSNRYFEIDRSKMDNCSCGTTNNPPPYTCKLKACRCGKPKKLPVEFYTCPNCGRNPKKMWTIPL